MTKLDETGDDSDRIEGLDRLVRSRAPSRDLWPGIQSRLRPRRSLAAALGAAVERRYVLGQLALAASLVVAVAATFSVTLRDAASPAAAPVAPVALAAAPQLTDDSRAIVKANLSMVRQAERQLRRALRDDPNSPALRSMLASAETRQRELVAML